MEQIQNFSRALSPKSHPDSYATTHGAAASTMLCNLEYSHDWPVVGLFKFHNIGGRGEQGCVGGKVNAICTT